MSHNPIRPWRNIDRRKSRQIMVGKVAGGRRCADFGADHDQHADHRCGRDPRTGAALRAWPGPTSCASRPPMRKAPARCARSCAESPVPIVADIHFHYKRAIEAAEAGAACLRINPGNIGDATRVREVIKAAKDHGCSIRIGVNAGSLEKHLLEKYGEPCPDAMVESGLDHIKHAAGQRFSRIQDLVKASDVFLAAAAYQQLARGDGCADPSGDHRGRRAGVAAR